MFVNDLRCSGATAGAMIIAFLAMMTTAQGCFRANPVLRVEFEEKIVPVSPINLPDSGWGTVLNQVFEGLFQISRSGQLLPVLVKDWSVDTSFRDFKFILRDDVVFHNGQKLTADDVAYSLDQFRAKSSQMSASFLFSEIASVSALNPASVRVVLRKSSPDFLFFLATPTVKIYPKGIFEKEASNPRAQWVGTGAFFLKSITESSLVLERFDQYREKFRLGGVIFQRESDSKSSFQRGDLDVLEVLRKDLPTYREDKRYLVNSFPMLGTFFLGFNLQHSAFKNVNLRRAIYHAIDRSKIIDGVTISDGMVPSGTIPYGLLGYKPARSSRNLGEARRLLSLVPRSQWPRPEDMDLLMPKVPHPMALFAIEQINRDLAEIGLPPLRARSMKEDFGFGNWGDYFHSLKENRRFAFYLRGSIAVTPSTEYFLRDLFDPQSPMNLSGYHSDEYLDFLRSPPKDILEKTLH